MTIFPRCLKSYRKCTPCVLIFLYFSFAFCSENAADISPPNLTKDKRPNFIVWVTDDMPFHFPDAPTVPPKCDDYPTAPTPNHDLIRANSLVFTRAYTSGPKCSPSRFNFITMKYCSRSNEGMENTVKFYEALKNVDPTLDAVKSGSKSPAKLFDYRQVIIGDNCRINSADSSQTLPSELQKNGYETIMSGKWHLIPNDGTCYDNYNDVVDAVKSVGFSLVDGVYCSNLDMSEHMPFSHNMEWILDTALKNVDQALQQGKPFFLYIAATPPNALGGSSYCDYVFNFPTTTTPAGKLNYKPDPGMPSRESVVERAMKAAGGDKDTACSNLYSGVIWLDDAMGAMFEYLERNDLVDNTFFLTTVDHGMVAKGHVYEGGIRRYQWIRYPALFEGGKEIDLVTNNMDVGATILDIAGITPSYKHDGVSFKTEAATLNAGGEERTIISEIGSDRAIIGPRYKYISRSWHDTHEMADTGYYPFYADNEQVYDLLADGGEQNNIAYLPANKKMLLKFRTQLEDYDLNVGYSLEMKSVSFDPVATWYSVDGPQTIPPQSIMPGSGTLKAIVPEGVIPGDVFSVQIDDSVMMLKCPPDVIPGDTIEFYLPQQQHYKATIPEGTESGDTFAVEVEGMLFHIVCPEGCQPGHQIAFQTSTKKQTHSYSIPIPEDLLQGDSFAVEIEGRQWVVEVPEGVSSGDPILFQIPPRISS